ncbi:MAG TPA: tetratricopeptide repeat protein [Sandaracinaceae bacterium]
MSHGADAITRDAGTRDAGERARAPSTCELAPGDVVDRFRIGRRIGEGGHGVVYEAEHVGLGYPVALKVLDRYATLDPQRRARFRREAVLGARLRHRNVVAIVDAGELPDRTPYLVMEHVEGIELAALLDRGTLGPAATADVGVQLLAALSALSRCEVLHRDIKPHNVMLARAVDGAVELKLLDFGISKALRSEVRAPALTREGFVLGTPQYMSPEQVRGQALDIRSDLYAAGALLYECLCGVPPFDGESAESVLTRILFEAPVPLVERAPGCPPELAAVIERALAKKPEDRYADPAEMSRALREVVDRLGLPRGADAWADVELGEAPVPRPLAERLAETASANDVRTRRAPRERPKPPSRVRRARWRPLAARVLWPALAVAALGAGVFTLARAPAHPPAIEAGAPGEPAEPEPLAAAVPLSPAPRAPIAEPRPAGRAAPREALPEEGAAASPAVLEQRALAAIVRGDDRRAAALYRRAIELEPERASAWRGLGLAAASAGDAEAARAAFGRYLSLRPRARDRAAIERRLAALARRSRVPGVDLSRAD